MTQIEEQLDEVKTWLKNTRESADTLMLDLKSLAARIDELEAMLKEVA